MRALKNLDPVTRYLELKAEIAALTEELDELKPLLYDALTDEPGQTFTHHGFRFSVGLRRTFTYSDEVNRLSARVRELKKAEENDGTARLKSATGYVVVREDPEALPFAV